MIGGNIVLGNVYLLDCTLRDGGYVNDWQFGQDTIKGFSKKIAQTGVEILEVGFIKGDEFDANRAVFPDVQTIKTMIEPKSSHMKYVAMIDMSAPVPLDRIIPYDGTSIDGIRIIFKKDKIEAAYDYCEKIQKLGYFVSVNFVGTDSYSEDEFVAGINRFNTLNPFAISIVDTFGLLKRKQFIKLARIADVNMNPNIALAYHSHNNLQQAMGNAEALVELIDNRDLIIDACVFGMGRGAGNLNLELFAEYMNENYDKHYKIEPMLEIMDEYLNDIYKTKFWGYSVPLYLSATVGCHPNYAIYLAEKDTLTVKSFNELLKSIPRSDRVVFSLECAEKYYRSYMENYVDDKECIAKLSENIGDRDVLLLAPGSSLTKYKDEIRKIQSDNRCVVIAVNFDGGIIKPDFIFSSNMRRFAKLMGKTDVPCITTSNMKECTKTDYIVNFSSYASDNSEIIDNSGIMLLKLLIAVGVKQVWIAGMDGYTTAERTHYYDRKLEYDFSREAVLRDQLISKELVDINKLIRVRFVTPTTYELE